MTERKLTTQPPTPQPGDLYNHVDENGVWIQQLTLISYRPGSTGSPPVGEFRAPDGTEYSIDIDSHIVVPCRMTKPQDDRDPVEVAERRRYRQRSRTTAPQRARAKCSDAKRKYIFFLGRQRGMHKEQIEDLAHGGDLKNLSIREAGLIIDRLQGKQRSHG